MHFSIVKLILFFLSWSLIANYSLKNYFFLLHFTPLNLGARSICHPIHRVVNTLDYLFNTFLLTSNLYYVQVSLSHFLLVSYTVRSFIFTANILSNRKIDLLSLNFFESIPFWFNGLIVFWGWISFRHLMLFYVFEGKKE